MGMFKNFLLRKMIAAQTKNLPKDQQEQIMAIVEKEPELFMKIAEEMQAEMKKGKNQMAAAMAVMPKYQDKLKGLMGPRP